MSEDAPFPVPHSPAPKSVAPPTAAPEPAARPPMRKDASPWTAGGFDESAPTSAPTPAPTPSSDAGPAALPTPTDRLAAPDPHLHEEVIEVLQCIFDPEIPVNIYDLGLVYGIDVKDGGAVTIDMTLTSPACPVAESLPPEVEQKVRSIPGVTSVKVNLVWEPPWGKHLLSETARLQLGFE